MCLVLTSLTKFLFFSVILDLSIIEIKICTEHKYKKIKILIKIRKNKGFFVPLRIESINALDFLLWIVGRCPRSRIFFSSKERQIVWSMNFENYTHDGSTKNNNNTGNFSVKMIDYCSRHPHCCIIYIILDFTKNKCDFL